MSKGSKKIRFSDHAHYKFEILREYGFEVSEAAAREAVVSPSLVDRRGDQILALKPTDRDYAVRVVYEMVNDNMVGVTFYSVRRKGVQCIGLDTTRNLTR